MSNAKHKPGIPPQKEGGSSDTDASASFDSATKARDFYKVVKAHLFHVNNWHHLAGAATARFQLTDAQGKDVNRTVQEGDYLKIDIPGPGPVTGYGYDWVQVETIKETSEGDNEQLTIQVRPASNPTNRHHDVAHFFSDEASSSFVVKREGNTVTAAVHGRNEKPNTKAETLVDKARNAAVATGAVAAFSKLQWKSLVNGLVKQE